MHQQLLLTAEAPIVAAIFDLVTGVLHDFCWSWQAGQNYANMGYRIQAINDDGYMTIAEAQELYDWELDYAIDCFGYGT